MSYKSSYKTAGYTLASDSKSIAYFQATTATDLTTVKGVTATDGLTVSGSTIKLAGNALSSKVTVSGSYNFDFDSDYTKATTPITARGKKVFVNGGKGSDTIKILGSSTTVKGGAGSDIFYYKSISANVRYDKSCIGHGGYFHERQRCYLQRENHCYGQRR